MSRIPESQSADLCSGMPTIRPGPTAHLIVSERSESGGGREVGGVDEAGGAADETGEADEADGAADEAGRRGSGRGGRTGQARRAGQRAGQAGGAAGEATAGRGRLK